MPLRGNSWRLGPLAGFSTPTSPASDLKRASGSLTSDPGEVPASVLLCLVVAITDGDTLKARCAEDGSYQQTKVRLAGLRRPAPAAVGDRRQQGVAKAIAQFFGRSALIKRCQEHKRRNVREHLPEDAHVSVKRALTDAWSASDADLAWSREVIAMVLQHSLMHSAECAQHRSSAMTIGPTMLAGCDRCISASGGQRHES